jgi:hypothetical protein
VQVAEGSAASTAVGTSSATFENSTITGNTQAFGSAINIDGSLTLNYVDVVDNTNEGEPETQGTGGRGAGAQFVGDDNAANITAETLESFGSVVTEPNGGPNCESIETPTDDGYNYSDDVSCGFDDSTSNAATGNDPMLGALADNGGPTQTLLPLTGSPLLDAIPTAVCTDVGILVDQRGITRPQGTGCDVGAVEVEVVPPPEPPPAAVPAAVVITPRFTG